MSTSSFDPRTGDVVATHPDTDSAEVLRLVALAEAASPAVAQAHPAVRSSWLDAVAATIEAHADDLIALADAETALGLPRLTAELARTAAQLRFYGKVAEEGSWLGATLDSATATSPFLARVNQPVGPVAVFGAGNFPFAFSVLGNDTASALAAGCPVVVKAHPAHVGLSHRLLELAIAALAEAGAPEGTLALVSGYQAGLDLVLAPAIQAVGFTGSEAGGLALWRLANSRPQVIPVYAEMGTVNPVVVTPAGAAELPTVAAGFVGSFTLGGGQYCTKPGVIFVPAGHDGPQVVADALTDAAPAPVMLTKGIAESVQSGLDRLQEAGATVLAHVDHPQVGWSASAAVLTCPIDLVQAGSPLLQEVFGAVALVVPYEDEAQLRTALAALPGSLAATVVTGGEDDPDAGWLLAALSRTAGRVTVGDWPTGVAWTWAQQHGGPWPATSNPKATSVGAAALDRFVRPVTFQSVVDRWLPQPLQADNPWGVPRRVDGVLTCAQTGGRS